MTIPEDWFLLQEGCGNLIEEGDKWLDEPTGKWHVADEEDVGIDVEFYTAVIRHDIGKHLTGKKYAHHQQDNTDRG